MKRPIAIDLFAGCGGLSTGLRSAGFTIRAAVESNKAVTPTYRANHRGTKLLDRDICSVSAKELLAACRGRPVALLAGCAPCQGFCSLTAKHRREDPRNKLVLQMASLIKQLKPEAVMMENVPGLELRGAAIFNDFLRSLKAAGYLPIWRTVQMADYGVPQFRRRLVLLAGKGFEIPFPAPTHAKNPKPGSKLKKWRTLRQAIGRRRAPVTMRAALRKRGPRAYNWHVVRNIQPQVKRRLKAAVPGKTWLATDSRIRPKCHRGGYDGFTNTYGRMAWTQTPVTITGGCTTASKGRFGHPDRRRTTISIREAASIQTFPRAFRFQTDYMEVVSDMIGNAVPPHFASVIGKAILQELKKRHAARAKKAKL
jgi:DNA (cytosine-5)-methyltransferase 1